MGFYAILDGVTVVLYKVMQTYNIMDSIPAEEVRLFGKKICYWIFKGILSSGFLTTTNISQYIPYFNIIIIIILQK